MKSTDVHGYNSLGNLLHLYVEDMHPDDFEFNEPLCAVLDSLRALHELVEPAWNFDREKLQGVAGSQVEDLKKFIGLLVTRFEEQGVCPEALWWFEKACSLCWLLDSAWSPVEVLRIPVNRVFSKEAQSH
jgi:hypothetical protein